MGGKAFDACGGEPAIAVERIPPSTYRIMQPRVAATLRQYYSEVVSPREAPEKPDHGDIDFMVQGPLTQPPPTATTLATALNAVRHRVNGPATYFAVPMPPATTEDNNDDDDDLEPKTYAQVDVHECFGNIAWMAFRHSDGDLWEILGRMIKPFGLTATHTGLNARLLDVDDERHKRSRLPLSTSPRAVMYFLGLDWAAHERGFATVDELFEWAVECRLFDREAMVRRYCGSSVDGNDDDFDNGGNGVERRKLRQRPMYARFVRDFLPSLQDSDGSVGGGSDSGSDSDGDELPSRPQVLEQAIVAFGKRAEYEAKMAGIRREDADTAASKLILAALETTGLSREKLNLVVRSIRRWVIVAQDHGTDDHAGIELRSEAEMMEDRQIWLGVLLDEKQGALREEAKSWLLENWEELKRLEQHRIKAAKAEREAARTNDQQRRELEIES